MKLRHLHVRNVKSFKDETHIDFNDDLNILIGPNAGGKSNLLDIILVVLRTFFIKEYRIEQKGIEQPRFVEADVFGNGKEHLERFNNDRSEQFIGVTFLVTTEDIDNINAITAHLEEFEKEMNSFSGGAEMIKFARKWDVSLLTHQTSSGPQRGGQFAYALPNLNHSPTQYNNYPALKLYLEYLNTINWFRILAHNIPNIELKPVLQHFSPTRSVTASDFNITLGQQHYLNLLNRSLMSNSRSDSSTAQFSVYHFVKKRREIQDKSFSQGWGEVFASDPEVQMVTRLLNHLGYSWQIEVVNSENSEYRIVLSRNGNRLNIAQSSSGEKELLNFILGLGALNTTDGIVIIDEPELHLHPSWQRTLLDMFSEEVKNNRNQFILSTHSPIFVNSDNLAKVLKIARPVKETKVVRVKQENLPELKDVLKIVNSHNNEKVLFADLVVLVEGITDRIVFSEILDSLKNKPKHSRVIEVLEVHGKLELKKYSSLLKELDVRHCTIADQDYLCNVGKEEIQGLFVSGVKSKHLHDKKSRDAKALKKAIDAGNMPEVKELFADMETRHQKLKEPLSSEELKILDIAIKECANNNVFILRHGEIEDYLPEGFRTLDKVIEFITKTNFWDLLNETGSYRDDLENIAKQILAM